MFEFSSSLAVSITSLASHAEIYNKKTNTRQMLKNKQKKTIGKSGSSRSEISKMHKLSLQPQA